MSCGLIPTALALAFETGLATISSAGWEAFERL